MTVTLKVKSKLQIMLLDLQGVIATYIKPELCACTCEQIDKKDKNVHLDFSVPQGAHFPEITLKCQHADENRNADTRRFFWQNVRSHNPTVTSLIANIFCNVTANK